MINKLKATGVALVAILAMSAIAASAAQAETTLTNGAGTPFTVKAEQSGLHTFTSGPRKFQCKKATFQQTGETKSSYSDVTISPTYTECFSELLGNTFDATVTMNGCDFDFNTVKKDLTGTVDVVCPAGQSIVIDVYSGTGVVHSEENTICKLTIGPQVNLGTVSYVNNGGSPETVTQKANVSGIKSKRIQGTLAACGAAEQTATYVGDSLVKGFNSESKQVSVMVG